MILWPINCIAPGCPGRGMVGPYIRIGGGVVLPELLVESVVVVAGGIVDLLIESRLVCVDDL